MPLNLDAVMTICKKHALEVKWFDGDGRKPGGALLRSRFEAPATVWINKRLRNQEERLKYELAFFIGHKILHNGDGMISPHSAAHTGEGDLAGSAGGMGAQDVLYAWRTSNAVFRRRAALSAHSVSPLPIREAHSVTACRKVGVTPALVMRRMTAVSPYRHCIFRCLPSRLPACGLWGNGIPYPGAT